METEELNTFLDQLPEVVRADGSTRTRQNFESELEDLRTQGYSSAIAGRVPGMVSIAAPVNPAQGAVTAAMQVAGASDEIPGARIDALGVEVRRAAFAVAQHLP